MKKCIRFFALTLCGVFMLTGLAVAQSSTVPEPFQRFDADSKYTIKYDDLTAVLKSVVVDTGRSTREVLQAAVPYSVFALIAHSKSHW